MRVLLTGGSSFTGLHFARELVAGGHEVVATLTRPPSAYAGLRGERVRRLAASVAKVAGEVRFGDDRFLAILREQGPFDLLAHHGAEVGDYKSARFHVHRALARNAHRLDAVLDGLRAQGRVLLTGSVFERGEGIGSEGLPAFSLYAVSKKLTAELFRHHCRVRGLVLGRFVVPNPFGPWEEPRLASSLARSWLEGGVPVVRSPETIRDHVHVSLLAKAYRHYAEELVRGRAAPALSPSGYPESLRAFAARLARELGPRLGRPCAFDTGCEDPFPEPRVRVNAEPLDASTLGWSEEAAWDALAAWYRKRFGGKGCG